MQGNLTHFHGQTMAVNIRDDQIGDLVVVADVSAYAFFLNSVSSNVLDL